VVTYIVIAGCSMGFQGDNPNDVIYVSVLCVVASFGFLYFAIDAILLENIFQYRAAWFIHGLIWIYIIWNYSYADYGDFYKQVSLGLVIVCGVFQLIYLILHKFVNDSFGYYVYKRISANPELQELYGTASTFFTYLKLDLATGILLLLLASFYLFSEIQELILNAFAYVFTVVWAMMGAVCVREENTKLMRAFFVFATIEPAYVIYKLVAIEVTSDYPAVSANQFWFTGGFALVVRALVLYYASKSQKNFGKGLYHVWHRTVRSAAISHLPEDERASTDQHTHLLPTREQLCTIS